MITMHVRSRQTDRRIDTRTDEHHDNRATIRSHERATRSYMTVTKYTHSMVVRIRLQGNFVYRVTLTMVKLDM